MKLVDMTVTHFTDVLESDAPAPGGGSAASLAGALGSALAAMVCTLTMGRKKYAEFEDFAKETHDKASALKVKLIDQVDKDTDAFIIISDAFGMPKETDEEKAARSAAIQKGLVACVESPLKMLEWSSEALHLVESMMGKFNTNSASDLGVAVLELRTAVLGAWLNVKINIGSMKDKDLAESFRAKGQAYVDELIPLADKLFAQIEELC